MKQTSSEKPTLSADQEVAHILWDLSVHYRVHKSPPLVRIRNRTELIHALPCIIKTRSVNVSKCETG
jgi:hypothetical protein